MKTALKSTYFLSCFCLLFFGCSKKDNSGIAPNSTTSTTASSTTSASTTSTTISTTSAGTSSTTGMVVDPRDSLVGYYNMDEKWTKQDNTTGENWYALDVEKFEPYPDNTIILKNFSGVTVDIPIYAKVNGSNLIIPDQDYYYSNSSGSVDIQVVNAKGTISHSSIQFSFTSEGPKGDWPTVDVGKRQ